MHTGTFDILRCPYCGSRLDLVASSFHETDGDEIHTGILGCQCCVFPVVDGIPVMHLQTGATAAKDLVEQRQPLAARRAMFGVEDASKPSVYLTSVLDWIAADKFEELPEPAAGIKVLLTRSLNV